MNRIIFFVAVALLITFLALQFPYILDKGDAKMHLLYSTIILSVVALSLRKIPITQTIKYAGSWIAVFLVIIIGYSYKDSILNTRIAGELLPNRARVYGDGSVAIRASRGGHFYIEAKVNGVAINFMIDTGASDVVLNKEDAQRIGINTDTLSYNRTYQTANGATGGAGIKLNRLQIGDFILDDFPASVNQGELGNSLLGMSAIKQLGGFKIDGDEMVIGKQ